MIYMRSFFLIIGFVFFCLFTNTLLSLPKAKMYPPKKVLRQRAFIYIGIAFFCFATAWLLR
ncbi:hypothetical protein BCV53_06755 [Parageobacillus thermoglucosidasius]|uniref:Uncharacterized protein n=1 Tax=Parageobacillus thermoglucosidasius TaxID=1426 RepID=A0AAN0YMA4_PARTM|nr:hypothetical protein Geoth_3177 [Parageobacillus thermoglucosidasius C56-YS93]ALF09715.1 hypothetical protein AOT13_06750 [Parageobacillus thermoglucosidasius]REK57705.1 MAG: hypothetical protein C6P36_06460 [Geobacillus sp.]ANZ29795.1 hypothetical protein BCV53_06755 [Parageobacillus thermoglucosidasius]APM80533.1 hypothetical protein BCV54_06760 [Parageobacillus thermoglucosidasius]